MKNYMIALLTILSINTIHAMEEGKKNSKRNFLVEFFVGSNASNANNKAEPRFEEVKELDAQADAVRSGLNKGQENVSNAQAANSHKGEMKNAGELPNNAGEQRGASLNQSNEQDAQQPSFTDFDPALLEGMEYNLDPEEAEELVDELDRIEKHNKDWQETKKSWEEQTDEDESECCCDSKKELEGVINGFHKSANNLHKTSKNQKQSSQNNKSFLSRHKKPISVTSVILVGTSVGLVYYNYRLSHKENKVA